MAARAKSKPQPAKPVAGGMVASIEERGSPDFTARRGGGCYENEITNIFHLAQVSVPEPIDFRKIFRSERDKFAMKLWGLKRSTDQGIGGHSAGWNAAIEEVLRILDDG